MSNEVKITNNLLNIKSDNTCFKQTMKSILKTLPQDLKNFVENIPQLPLIATDNYYLHYSIYPMLRGKNDDEIMQKALDIYKEYMKSNVYQKAKLLTTLDHDLSMIHTISLTKKILMKIKEEVEKLINNMKKQKGFNQLMSQAGIGNTNNMTTNQIMSNLLNNAKSGNKNAKKIVKKLLNNATNNVFNRLHSQLKDFKRGKGEVNEMFKDVKKGVENAKDLKDLMRGGKKAGKTGTMFEKILNLMNEILSVKLDEVLSLSRKITDSMPRFTHIKKKRDKFGSEVFGYRLTHNISHAIPRELALPDDLFYVKIAGSGLLAKEKIRVVEGAYYVLIDKSGSMEGHKTVWARSVALALYRLAKRKKREYFLRFFDTEVYPINEPISKPEKIIEHIVKIGSEGGTKIDHALSVAIKDLCEKKFSEKTNTIILITDGEDEVETKPQLLKSNNIRLIAIMIKGYNKTLKTLAEKSGGDYLKAVLDEKGALRIIRLAERG